MIIHGELVGLLLRTGYIHTFHSLMHAAPCAFRDPQQRLWSVASRGSIYKQRVLSDPFTPPESSATLFSSSKEGLLLCFVALLALDEHVWQDTLIFKWLRSPHSLSLCLCNFVPRVKNSVCIIQCDACSCTLSLKCEWWTSVTWAVCCITL